MTNRTTLAALAALSLTLPGCFFSCGEPIDEGEWNDPQDPTTCWSPPSTSGKPLPNTRVRFNGTMSRADGSPLTGNVLFEDPATLGDVFWTVASLGAFCLFDDVAAGASYCEHYAKLDLTSYGRYGYEIDESATRAWLIVEYAKTFSVYASAPKAEGELLSAGAALHFKLESQEVTLPELTLWEPQLAVRENAGELHFAFSPPPTFACTKLDGVQITFADRELNGVWSQPADPVDPRVLEDVDGVFYARASYTDGSPGPVESFELSSGGILWHSTAGAPPSRGAACTVGGHSYAAGSCPLTDGKFGEVEVGGGPLTVDLGEIRPLQLVVLRGAFVVVYLESSTDGQQWTRLDTLDGGSRVLRPNASARYLRLTPRPQTEDEYGGSFMSMSEISVW